MCISEWITPWESWFNFGRMLVICLFATLMSSPTHAHPVAVAEVFRAGHRANYNALRCKIPISANSHLEAAGCEIHDSVLCNILPFISCGHRASGVKFSLTTRSNIWRWVGHIVYMGET